MEKINYIIYLLIDPRNNEPKYIGQTRCSLKQRLQGHLQFSKSNGNKNKNSSWINSLIKINLKPIIEEIDSCDSFEKSNELEKFWISYYKFLGCNLKNSTSGGRDCEFFIKKVKRTKESKKKQSELMKGKYSSGELINKRKGIKLSENAKEHLSKITSFRNLSDESIEKRAKSNTGKKRSEEQKSNLKKGQLNTYISKKDFRIIKVFKQENFEGYFLTPNEVGKYIGTTNIPNISACLKGIIKSTKGYYLKYGDEKETYKVLYDKGFIKTKFNYPNSFEDIIISRNEFNLFTNEEKEKLAEQLIEFIENIDFIYPKKIELDYKIINGIKKNCKEDRNFLNTLLFSEGTIYLKSFFKSFYKSSNINKISFFEEIKIKKNIKKVLMYRMGVNNLNESWDISFKTIMKGYSAIRTFVSFFKPTVAYSIYKHFLIKEDSIVLDPCCGFGGRMLGFFSAFPKGKYIGCEPNQETFNELIILKNDLSNLFGYQINCEIYNIKFEDFEKQYTQIHDLCFTSIPYYNLEKYSEDIIGKNYNSFEDWEKKFIGPLKKMNNCYINLSEKLFEQLKLEKRNDDYYLINNSAFHLNKSNKIKKEIIASFN